MTPGKSMRLGLYDHCILPRLTHLVMRDPRLARYDERAVARARGEMLGIGQSTRSPARPTSWVHHQKP